MSSGSAEHCVLRYGAWRRLARVNPLTSRPLRITPRTPVDIFAGPSLGKGLLRGGRNGREREDESLFGRAVLYPGSAA